MEPKSKKITQRIAWRFKNFHAKNFSNARLDLEIMNIESKCNFHHQPFSNSEKAEEYFSPVQKEFESEGHSSKLKSKSLLFSIEIFKSYNKRKICKNTDLFQVYLIR